MPGLLPGIMWPPAEFPPGPMGAPKPAKECKWTFFVSNYLLTWDRIGFSYIYIFTNVCIFVLHTFIQLKSKLHAPCRICKCWLFYQVREITQNACYCLFSTDLNKIFVTWMMHSCVFCLVIVVHESLVCPEQLNCLLFFRKSFSSHKFFGFPAFLCIWTLSNIDCMILRSIFSYRGQLRDSFATITEDSNTHRCPRRKNHALRAMNLNLKTWIWRSG